MTLRNITRINRPGYLKIINGAFHLILAMLILFAAFQPAANAYNMRQSFSGDGLSNSAILSLCYDNNGYLWIGTCDGVNIADGTSIHSFPSLYPGQVLSGNIIEAILNGSDGDMWVLTNYALDLVEAGTREVRSFAQFHGQERLCMSPDGKLIVITEDSRIYVYDSAEGKEFAEAGKIGNKFSEIRSISFKEGNLWVVMGDSIHVYDIAKARTDGAGILPAVKIFRNIPNIFARANGDELFIISKKWELCEILPDGKVRSIMDLSSSLSQRGDISDLTHDHQGNFFLSFRTDGVIWVGLNEQKEYMAVDLGLQVGVFCLECSKGQDVVWIGSDCQGVYTFWDDQFSVRSYDFNAFNNKISHPVRSIFIDDRKNLWLGTKGDGLLQIPEVNEYYPRSALGNGRLFTSSNSALWHNSVFAFSKSSRPVLWVGTEEGINYFSYADNELHRLDTDPKIRLIHGIYEENDSTLWMSTLGLGIAKATISGPSSAPVLKDIKLFTLDNGRYSANQFFSITVGNNGELLFCNRGKGIYKLEGGRLVSVPVKTDFGTNTVNDVFTAALHDGVLWLGTGCGLVKSWQGGEKHYSGVEYGFTNNTIHDMLLTGTDEIWLSTNDGIVRFNSKSDSGETFGKSYGLSVTEYSDGAGFYTGSTLIFGGINGVTFVNRHETYTAPEPYLPEISLLKISISGMEVPLDQYYQTSGKKHLLNLDSNQNYFSITVAAPDFIDASNYIYSYSLDGVNWINNASETSISFNGMDYGKYNLRVKYLNRATGLESDPWTLMITVRAPWYLSGFMKAIYILLVAAAVGLCVWTYLRRQKLRQEDEMKRLEQAHKEEVYEEKLKFFTNITHEFCTPLTLIYGPCERIIGYPGSDDYIRKYIGLVRSNAERLNTLIQELIDFRRMETGNKRLKIYEVGISELCSDIMTSFSELAERNNVEFINEIEPDIQWPTDFGCIRKIMTNLISNAFKYTHSGGRIKVRVKVEGELLRISVYNTGKGISEEDKTRIFNRYSVLDNVEENAVKGLSSRNGLGLAICHSMVDMLQGKIIIESEVGQYADFIVTIPKLELTEDPGLKNASESPSIPAMTSAQPESADECQASRVPDGDNRSRILVVDDNRDILRLLRDSLSEYDVETAESVDLALESLRRLPPDLIISDIMMPGTDGVSFTKMIRQNRHTMHIPLILLSAKNRKEEKVEGIESGADAYIGKPFSLDYLLAVVRRLLENRRNLREYYSTAASAYEYTDGQLMHKKDKEFMEQITTFIEENIEDEDLGPEKLANHMRISVRNLYRKFKELDQLSPNDFIKHQRISFAARLLVTTSATVQEIVYRSGFTNRSHFYKEFDKRFGMTPKAYRESNTRKDTSLES